MRTWTLLLLVFLCCSQTACWSQKNNFNRDTLLKEIYTSWTLDTITYLNISALPDSEVKNLSQTQTSFDQENAIVFNEQYKNPVYTIQKAQTDSLLINDFGIKGSEIGVNCPTIYIITIRAGSDLNSTSESEIFFSGKKLYYIKDGVVFVLKQKANDKMKTF